MGGGHRKLAHHQPDRHRGLLDLLGVEAPSGGLPARQPASSFVLWSENEAAYFIFIRVSGHGQWQRGGMEGQVIGLDGQYLISYLKLTYDPAEIPDLLDDVHCIVDGWVTAQNQKRKQQKS